MPGVLPWSYSSLQAFETCSRRFYLTRIKKVVSEPQSEAMLHGNRVHKALELAVGGTQTLGKGYESYQPIVDRLRATSGDKHTEQKFGLTADFKPTTFFGKDVWMRGVLDLTIVKKPQKVAIVLDYKTGKVKTDGDQLKLFAAATFAQYPWLQTVKTGYIWLAEDKTTAKDFTPEDVPVIWQEFMPRIKRMELAEENNKWLPNPSGLCKRHCSVGKRLCEYCGTD